MNWSPKQLVARSTMSLALAGSIVGLALAGCGSSGGSDSAGDATAAQGSKLPTGSEPANLDPAEFTTKVDNPYWPMSPGTRWVSREIENGVVQRVVVTVTNRTKVVDGVKARVIHDVVSAGGQPIEKTYDWYAQDSSGNVWYLGEDTKEYDHGKVASTAGSWEAGIGGAEAGVILPGEPAVGQTYRQEYDKGNAEDNASVTSVNGKATVPYGSFDHVLQTRDVNPLETNFVEHKSYARGIGPVETIQVSGGQAHEELLSYKR